MKKQLLRSPASFYLKLLAIILASIMYLPASAQSPCMPSVPSYTIDLTGDPAGIWSSPNISRNGQCCSATSPDQCVFFNLTLDPNTAGIQIDMIGADPAGSLFYDIGCSGHFPGGQIKCISGVGPHLITFCKPGGNKNVYKITSISKPLFPKDDTTRIGCRLKLKTLGIVNNSVTWQSIYPGTPGQYNSYLDSINVASPTYSPTSGAPAYVDYKVCGFPIASGCGFSLTVCDTVRIYNYPSLTTTVTPNPATFCNVGPGSGVTLSGLETGGLSPYTLTWRNASNTVVGTGTTYFASAAGIYNLEVKDKLYDPSYCPAVYTSVSVAQGTIPVVDACADQKVCKTNPLASLTGTVQYATGGVWSGGTGTYNPGNSYLNTTYSPSAAELAAGFVKLYLTSSGAGGGCTNKKDSTIIYYAQPVAVSITGSSLACNNSTTTLTASLSGGTAPFSYLWSTGATGTNIHAGQGNYSVIVTDSVGCTSNANINLVAPAALTSVFTVTNVSVNGGNNGAAAISISGGTPAYTVTWTPTGLNTFTISNLTYGIYTATIKDVNGCLVSGSTIVNEPRCLAFTAAATATNVLCNGGTTGQANVTVSGGTPAYTYTWNTTPVQNSATASSLQAGVYSVQVKDINNCYQTANVTITEPTALTNVMTHTDVTSIGGNNGSATANPFGGTSPYTYSWNTGATTQGISGLTAATYSVNITDTKGCLKSDSIKITQPPCNNLTLNVLSYNILCHGGNNGSALAIVSGATGSYTINWSNGATGPSATALSAGNYSVSITDSKNCIEFFDFSITEPAALSAALLPTNSRCNSTDDGTIDLTVSGGTYPYSFSWNNGSTSEDLVNLAPGTYGVKISDANGCSALASAIITEPTPISVTYTSQNVSCIYGTNGAAGTSVNGGTFPYFYTWSTGATTSAITGLSAGGYTVSVRDANNCSIVNPLFIPINQPDSLKADSFIVSCSVPGTGLTQVSVIPTGGYSGTYQVSYDNGVTYSAPGVYTTMLNNAATYSVVLKDGNNCLSPKADILNILSEVKLDSIRYSKCYAAGTFSSPVTVYASGGDSGPYSISFNNGLSYMAAGTYSDNVAIASTYTVMVRDGRSCTSGVQTIVLPTAFDANVVVISDYNGQNISCYGLTDGSAQVNAVGGNGVYTYTWTSTPVQTSDIASGLGAGTYTVQIKDGNNCSLTQSVTLTQPAVLSATASISSAYNGQNISCYGLSDGTASVTAAGGTTPYSYAWSTAPAQNTANAANLSAGTYSVVVKDVNNCPVTQVVTLTQPAAIAASVSVTSTYNGQQISCYGNSDASITVSALSGTAPYTYTWSTSPVQTGTLVSSVGAGTYSVVVTDLNGCSITKTITVSQPNPIVSTASVTSNYNGQNISCFNTKDGSASVATTGGTGTYSYSWTTVPSQNTMTATNLGAGTYSVTVTDINGCNTTTTITLVQPAELIAQLFDISSYNGYNISCKGLSDGYLDITVNGGTGNYSYAWSNASVSQDINNLAAGNYSVIVMDVNACKDTLLATLIEPTPLIVLTDSLSHYNGYNISCNGSTNGAIYVTASGGVAGYSYAWSNNTALQDLSNVGAGTYTLIVSDLNRCEVTIDTTLTQPLAISYSLSVVSPACYGTATGTVDVSINGGVLPYTYQWSNSATTQDLNGIASGSYTLSFHDKNGCSNTYTVSVTQPDTLSLTKQVDNLKCNGDTIGNIFITPHGGTSPYTYAWNSGSLTQNLNNIPSGTYVITVTDAKGCVYKDTTKLSQPDSLKLHISSPLQYNGYNVSSYTGSDGSIEILVNGGTQPYNYLWSNGATTQNLYNLPAGNYYVTVSDTNGCRISGDITLTQPLILEMPQGFSPNGDDKNDLFVVHGIEAYPDNVLTIYNRWGNIVYSKTGYQNDWNGSSNNDQALPDATYFVILEINKGDIVLKGYVELRR